jgi:hypothetical protein
LLVMMFFNSCSVESIHRPLLLETRAALPSVPPDFETIALVLRCELICSRRYRSDAVALTVSLDPGCGKVSHIAGYRTRQDGASRFPAAVDISEFHLVGWPHERKPLGGRTIAIRPH